MPVNTLHPDFEAICHAWSRARDVFAGEDAVKTAGEKYLPASMPRAIPSTTLIAHALHSSMPLLARLMATWA
jgi:hypothetical protein